MAVRHDEVKLAGRLPGADALNGMGSIHHQLVNADPSDTFLCGVWCDVLSVTTGWDSDGSPIKTPTLRVRRIEPLGEAGEVSQALREAIMKAAEDRLGSPALPFDVVDADQGRDLDDDEAQL